MMKEFDPTKPVQTRSGRPARIVSTKGPKAYPLIVVITRFDGSESVVYRTIKGLTYDAGMPLANDLVNVPNKKTLYALLTYSGYLGKEGSIALASLRVKPPIIDSPYLQLDYEDDVLVNVTVIKQGEES